MAITMKIRYVSRLKNGSYKFRRRLPVDVFEGTGKEFIEGTFKSREPDTAEFRREYEVWLKTWQMRVDSVRLRGTDTDTRTPEARLADALEERSRLLRGVVGIDDAEAAQVIAEDAATKLSPLQRKVLLNPETPEPAFTLVDARNKYVADKGIGENVRRMKRMDRVFTTLRESLGDPKEFALVDLRKAHGGKWLETLKAYRNENTGKPYAVSTMQRMTTDLKAVVNHAIKYVDFDKPVANPFMSLPYPEEDQITALERVSSMPEDVLKATQARIDERARTADLPVIWRMLRVTGCRLSEIAFLQMRDVDLDNEIPQIHIRPNEFRRVKDLKTVRTLPLTGEGLEAARKWIAQRIDQEAAEGDAVFPRRAKTKNDQNATEAAANSLSQTLMLHVRAITEDPKIVVHSLRHRLLDRLRDAGASAAVRDPFGGHSIRSTGDTTYGSVQARVRELHRWAVKANP